MRKLHDILGDETRPHIILAHFRRQQLEIEDILRVAPHVDPDFRAASIEILEELAICYTFTLILTGFAQKHAAKLNAARRERDLEGYRSEQCEASKFGIVLANRVLFPSKGLVSEYNDILYAGDIASAA